MKRILPLLLITLMLVGCGSQVNINPPPTTSPPKEVNTDQIAEDFVKSLSEYSDYNGGGLTLIRKVSGGYAKWDYVYRFTVNTNQLASSIKFIEVRLMIQEGEVTHNLVAEVDEKNLKLGAMTQSECESMGGRLANNIAGALCNDGETNKGDLLGYIIPYVCCV